MTREKLASSNVKRKVVVWKARKRPKRARGTPAANAATFDFTGDPGTPKMLPRAKDPTARLKDGSMTSRAATGAIPRAADALLKERKRVGERRLSVAET